MLFRFFARYQDFIFESNGFEKSSHSQADFSNALELYAQSKQT